MKVLITGATGFLGRHLIKRAKELKWDISVLSRRGKVSSDSPALCVYRGDLASPGRELQPVFENQDLVIHAAVDYQSPTRSLEMTKTVIRLCLGYGVSKVIFISSHNASFENPHGYSLAKRQSEELVRTSSLNWGMVRPTIIYDEGGGFLLDSMIRPAGNLCFILIPGRGDMTVQPVHAEDVARGVEKLVFLPSGTCLTVAGSQIVSFRRLADEIRKEILHAVALPIPTGFLKAIGFFHSGIRSKVEELHQIKTLTPVEERLLDSVLGNQRHGILQDLPLILSYQRARSNKKSEIGEVKKVGKNSQSEDAG